MKKLNDESYQELRAHGKDHLPCSKTAGRNTYPRPDAETNVEWDEIKVSLYIRRQPKFSLPQALGFTAVMSFYILIYTIGPDFLIPTQTRDTNLVSDMALDMTDFSDGAGGYYYTALFLSYLPQGWDELIVLGVATLFICTIFSNIKTIIPVALASFLCLSPIILFLFTFVKDTFTPLLVILCLYIVRLDKLLSIRIVPILALYIVYGIFFRQYYLLIAAAFAGFLAFRIANWYFRFALLLIAMAALMLLPDAYFYEVGNIRDYLNRGRGWGGISGPRSAFVNLVPATNAINFLINYAYAIARLNLPILFSSAAQEIFLMINVVLYAFLSFIGLKERNERVQLPVILFLSHIAVLQIFEGDLGSYLRHVCSILPYLTPALVALDGRYLRRRLRTPPPSRSRWARVPQQRGRRGAVTRS